MLFITSVVFMIVPVLSRYTGYSNSCNGHPGPCSPLSQCEPLMDEIKAAGNPMPVHMRRKLHELTCGFTNSNEPLICCPNDQTSTPDLEQISIWTSGDRPGQNSQIDNSGSNLISPEDIVSRVSQGPPDVQSHPNLGLLPTDCGIIDSNRILGGNRTQLYEMPWMVILSYDDDGVTQQNCGGTLINEWYVLTAAHCVAFLNGRTLNGVILGEYDTRTDPDCEVSAGSQTCAPRIVNASIASVIAHPGYRRKTLFDDIALIRLADRADFRLDTMAPICLPLTMALQRENLDELNGVVAGWGLTEDKIQSPVLLSVPLPIITNKQCQTIYRKGTNIYDSQLCAGGVRDKDSCGGDSGGPLMYPGVLGAGGVRYIQRGVVSFGPRRCGIGNQPGVYTRTAYYMKWILDNMHS